MIENSVYAKINKDKLWSKHEQIIRNDKNQLKMIYIKGNTVIDFAQKWKN